MHELDCRRHRGHAEALDHHAWAVVPDGAQSAEDVEEYEHGGTCGDDTADE